MIVEAVVETQRAAVQLAQREAVSPPDRHVDRGEGHERRQHGDQNDDDAIGPIPVGGHAGLKSHLGSPANA